MSTDIQTPDAQDQLAQNQRVVGRPFQPGESGNPGGLPKGFVKISAAYARLLMLPEDELQWYKPKNSVERIALEQIKAARGDYQDSECGSIPALPSVKEITDRTEGKAPQTIRQTSEVDQDLERVKTAALAVDIVSMLTKLKERQDLEARTIDIEAEPAPVSATERV